MTVAVLGLDVGGAHLKYAGLAPDGRLLLVGEKATPLWHDPASLDRALARLPRAPRVVATMTGELVDRFPDRARGVVELVGRLVARFGEAHLGLYAGRRGFVTAAAARCAPRAVASANWRATAELCARLCGSGLLVDIGSTTTDLVPFREGRVTARGEDDASRLAAGELIYLGFVRTPLCALGPAIPFAGGMRPLMNEVFATTADVFRLLGLLEETDDRHPAADGGPKTREGSVRRLARMVGADLADAPAALWEGLARAFAARLLHRLEEAALGVLSAAPLAAEAPVVAAGCGHALAARLAARLERPCLRFSALVGAPAPLAHAVDVVAPALAVARLALADP